MILLNHKYVRVFCIGSAFFFSVAGVFAENLIEDPQFEQKWLPGVGELHDTSMMKEAFQGETVALGIAAGRDRQGRWSTPLRPCEPGSRYRFEAEFYRENRNDSRAYPEVRIWGQSFRLNTHRIVGKYQPLWAELECSGERTPESTTLSFINRYPDTAFWMRNPKLFKLDEEAHGSFYVPEKRFFPIGVYGANGHNLEEIRQTGLNTGVIGLKEENLRKCIAENMHCTVVVPRDPERLREALERLEPLLRSGRFAFYVNDEPGIHSFPRETAEQIQQIVKERFPESYTNMAIVRPWVIPEYRGGADYFMLDQYPVPDMPLTWLADSMDEAATHVGRGRLQSVIQAFGGSKHAHGGWPRLPSFEEMNHLAFLSVIHGSRGIYFYTWPEISVTEQSLADFTQVVRILNSMYSWLLVRNHADPVKVEMISDYEYGPSGKPAVHCARKERHNTRMLICANVLRTYVEAEVGVDVSRSVKWEDYFTGDVDYVVDNNLSGRFEPLEVKVWMEQK